MADTEIQWADLVWNPVRGCQRVSPGCGGGTGPGSSGGCYAERMAHRFSGPGQPYEGLTKLTKKGPRWTGAARFVPEKLGDPIGWKKPQRVFVNSMSDLFHDDITNEQIAAVFGVMGACHRHTFQVLTKRPQRMREWFAWVKAEAYGQEYGLLHDACGQLAGHLIPDHDWNEPDSPFEVAMYDLMGVEWPLPNVWLGVSVENQAAADERIPLLLDTPAAVRWVSAEPLIGPVDFKNIAPSRNEMMLALAGLTWTVDTVRVSRTHARIDWVVCGGESGPGARPCDLEWIRSIVQQCSEAQVPAFVKQLGAHPFERREAEGGVHGTHEALANLGKEHPQRPWFKDWCLTHTPDGRSTWYRHPRLKDKKGGDIEEWPADLRVRHFPEVRHAR